MTDQEPEPGHATAARPFDYTIDLTTRHLVPNPDEAHLVTEMFTVYTRSRLGTRTIATRGRP